MSECKNQEAVKRIKDTFGEILANVKVNKQSFPKNRRSRSERKSRERRAPTEDTPDRVISLYPEEIQTFQICADYQDGHWTVLGKHMNNMGPVSHEYVINELLPSMDVFDRSYRPNGSVNLTQETTQYYVNIESMFATGTLSIVPRDGVRYWHQDYNDPDYVAPYTMNDYIPYPQQDSWKFKAGKQLNFVLRHQIGRYDGKRTVKCNRGAWVLVEDLLQIDSIWRDECRYGRALERDPNEAIRKVLLYWHAVR